MSDGSVVDVNKEVFEMCKGGNYTPREVMLIQIAMMRTAARLGHTVRNPHGEIREPSDILGDDVPEQRLKM